MEIDLFTLVAQIINLIILLLLLRKFLYLPVLKAVAERQKAIADELESAETARKEAQSAEAKSIKQMQKLEAQKQKILLQAHDKAEKLGAELNEKAHAEYRQAQQQFRDRMKAEQSNFELAMQKSVAEQFNRFAEKALEQIADADINVLAVKKLIAKIEALPEETKKEYIKAFHGKKKIKIQSAMELPAKMQKELENYLRSAWQISSEVQFVYELKPELLGGLCVGAEEQLVAWNFEVYMQEFRNSLNKTAQQFLNRGEK